MIVTYPGKRPASLRVDQLDRDQPIQSKSLQGSANSSPTHRSSNSEISELSELSKCSGNSKPSECSKHCGHSKHSGEATSPDHRRTRSARSRSPEYSKASCSHSVKEEASKQSSESEIMFPEIVHFGIRPPQLSYAGNPE